MIYATSKTCLKQQRNLNNNYYKQKKNLNNFKCLLNSAITSMISKGLNICSWNANGLKTRISELKEFINRQKVDIMIINDTRFTETHRLKVKTYTCIRKDVTQKTTGGIIMIVRNAIDYRKVNIKNDITIQSVAIKLKTEVFIIGVYNPPSNYFKIEEIEKLLKKGNKVLLIGDLNARRRIIMTSTPKAGKSSTT